MKTIFIGIVGGRNTGKSTFTLELSESLIKEKFTVNIVKYSHSHYSIEPRSKDSALFHRSKVDSVIFSSPYETVAYHKNYTKDCLSLYQILAFFPEKPDLILCESYPDEFPPIPLIFIIREELDFQDTKKRFKGNAPLFISGPYAEKNKGHIEGIPILSFKQPEDLPIISRIVKNLIANTD